MGKDGVSGLSAENQLYLDRFATHLKIQGRSPRTMNTYKKSIIKLLNAIDKDAKNISFYDVEAYQGQIVDRISSASMATYISAWKAFFEYTGGGQDIDKLKRPRVKQKLAKYLTTHQMKQIFKNLKNTRERVMVCLLYYGGLRLNELINLKKKDINVNGEIRIEDGKGGKDGVVVVPKIVISTIQQYLKETKNPEEKYLITISSRRIQIIVKEIGIRAGIPWLHPHTFRHSITRHLRENGVAIEDVSKFLRHSRITTTYRYAEMDNKTVLDRVKVVQNNLPRL